MSARTLAAPVRFSDGVIAELVTHIASVPPERGAVLLGMADLVTLAVHDGFGDYGPAHWDISPEINETVQRLERAGAGQFLGTVHSHPRGVVDPSGTDIASTAETLRLNPHIGSLIVAIITRGEPGAGQLSIGVDHRMSLHRVHLEGGRPVVVRITGSVVDLVAPLADVGIRVDSGVSAGDGLERDAPYPRTGRYRGRESVFLQAGPERVLVVPAAYPLAGPVRVEAGAQGPRILPSPWDPATPPAPQLRALAGGVSSIDRGERLHRALPLVGDLAQQHVVVAGLGSVGSRIAEDLVRAGVGRLTLIDPEEVEAANLSRSVYVARDVGLAKSAALARRLEEVAPDAVVRQVPQTLGETDLGALVRDATLVIGATDDMREQFLLAHHAYAAGVPMVCCAMYAGARAGEIVIALPSADSACVSCALGNGSTTDMHRPAKDYGLGGRLVAEPGLGASIQLVASAASLVALGILAGPEGALAPLVAESVGRGRTLGMLATHPAWDFFPDVVGGPTQVAPQSVWVKVERDPACVVCGDLAARVAPASPGFWEGLEEALAVGDGATAP
ncbi:ThiF family adenylyltransferase [Microbacterium sp. 1P10AE]|uniref:ThiF family adenylyltransferase n=1 Tax=Microbacterium sp. 1P10AE TaxID=3132286 RepID=UPI0039A18DFC